MASRPAVLALILGAVVAFPGCQAGMSGSLASRPDPIRPGASLTANEAIERHNLNAARVHALQAQPSITVSAPGLNGARADGKMAMELPKNFKLTMNTKLQGTVADIGSNDEEFWFWTKSKQDKNVYVCSYEDLRSTPLSAAFQPEWIVEAMGLRPISRDEAQKMTVKQGDAYGTTKLISTRKGNGGVTLTKETTIDSTGHIKEHRLFQGQGDKKVLLAQATIEEFRDVAVEGKEPVSLPYRFRLSWLPEKLTLDIQLDRPTIRSEYGEEQRAILFAEPQIPYTKRRNIAELIPSQAPATTSSGSYAEPAVTASPRTRTSRPAPSAENGVRLGSPEPFGTDDAGKATADPVSLTADLADPPADPSMNKTVRPSLPRAVDP